MTFEEKTYNAKIRFAWLGLEPESTVLTVQIGFEYEGGVINTKKRNMTSLSEINVILTALGVNSWEELNRKFVRIKIIDKNVIAVGNIIENKWLDWSK